MSCRRLEVRSRLESELGGQYRVPKDQTWRLTLECCGAVAPLADLYYYCNLFKISLLMALRVANTPNPSAATASKLGTARRFKSRSIRSSDIAVERSRLLYCKIQGTESRLRLYSARLSIIFCSDSRFSLCLMASESATKTIPSAPLRISFLLALYSVCPGTV